MKVTLVTGASQNHFKTLIQFIECFIVKTQNSTNNIKLIVYDLGLDSNNFELIQLKFKESNIEYKAFDYSQYPDYFNININAGEYAWKPCILYNECVINGDIVIWMDSGNLLLDNLSNLIKEIKENYIHTACTSGNIKLWTHPLTLSYLNCPESFLSLYNRNGACVGINYNIDYVKDFINEWKNCALVKDCIAPSGSSRQNHRQDQSVLSVLYYKYLHKYNFYTQSTYNGYVLHQDID